MNGHNPVLIPNPEGPFPPLPDPLPPFPEPEVPPLLPPGSYNQPMEPIPWPRPWPPFRFRSLRCGCYLLNYSPRGNALVGYDGTLRVECHNGGRTASGDLYQRPVVFLPSRPGFPPILPRGIMLAGPSPAAGIPILARGYYRYYLRVTQILENWTFANGFVLGFERWRFTRSGASWSGGGTWTNEGLFTAGMRWQPAPAGYPSSGDYLAGDLKNPGGTIVGTITMGWISPYLRRATIEIDRVNQAETALNNGAGVDWRTIGDAVGWDLTVDESDVSVPEPGDESWSDGECHAEMLARRDAANLDSEWRYHVLCVRRLDSTSRGIMYDAYAGDSNNVPREGCALASHWTIPNSPEWGTVQGVRFGLATSPYFRTAVHETGHAMGLYHNTADNGFMNTTDVIASRSLSPGSASFPANVQWSYNSEDAKRLRHMPDIYVRPGGVPFGTSYASTPISPTDLEIPVEGLALHVSAVIEAVPIGAPVRVNVELVNESEVALPAPASLSLRSGLVRGKVIDSAGTVRTFSPLVLCLDTHPIEMLGPGDTVHHSMTLLRGAQGALFPTAGPYRLVVEVHWDNGGVEALVTGSAEVMVTPAVDEAHAEAALKVLSTPDALLTLVLGGDHLDEGIEAIQVALANPVLRPHFAYIEAKRVGQRFRKRKANLKAAADLIDESAVMSPSEIAKAAVLVKTEGEDTAPGKRISKALKAKVEAVNAGDDVRDLVDSL